jgi:Ca-activated chloride channel homolog
MKQLLFIVVIFFALMAFKKNKASIITGKVTDKSGVLLKHISVQVKGSLVSAETSRNGIYTISVENKDAVLVFFADNFRTKEINVKGRTNIDVVLDTLLKISGIVTDKNGGPVSGASIKVKGNKTGTSTRKDGAYDIAVDTYNSTLVFSSVGYVTAELRTKGIEKINAQLEFESQNLNEVVVIGYGSQRKRMLSASVQSPTASYVLQGKVAGVNVSGAVGSTTSIRIRGNTSIIGSNSVTAGFDGEGYDNVTENGFLKTTDNPLSTFSIDVDAASYSNVRRHINNKILPPAGAVRIEEMINYFKYDYPQPANDDPFSINTEIATAPWSKEHKLILIGLQGKNIPEQNLPPGNLVFLIDVSGSMMSADKLPLVKHSMKMLVDRMRPQDKVAIVVYAGAAGLVLPSTNGKQKVKIKDAIDRLEAGGSTAGGAGIKLAYETAINTFIKDGNNRVILCTDGDFNVGESSDDAMENLIEEKRKSGVFLTVLGYGTGNYQDSKMQKLADKGNGNHAYIDGISEAKKVLINEFGSTLFTIAKDVKLQVEFNPAKVQAYRLIGYENRMLAKEDFNDDKKDAGDLGSGHTVTALYEVIPVGVKSEFIKTVDSLKYQDNNAILSNAAQTDEIMTVKFRYKKPGADSSQLIVQTVKDEKLSIETASENFRFATAVAEFGMLLCNSAFKGISSYTNVIKLAGKAKGTDEEGYRSEFIALVKTASSIKGTEASEEEDETK